MTEITEMDQKYGKMENSIRSFVTSRVLPKYENLDEEDAVTVVSILVEVGLLDASGLHAGIFDLHKATAFQYTRNPVDDSSSTDTRARGRRIINIRLGRWNSSPWEFHEQRVFELLAKLDKLEVLRLEQCKSFRLTEFFTEFPNLRKVDVNCSTRDQIMLGAPAGLRERIEDSNLERLQLYSHVLSEDELALVLFDILPMFPKILHFEVGWSKITSFQEITQRIYKGNINTYLQSSKTDQGLDSFPPSRLRCLHLGQFMFSGSDTYTDEVILKQDDPKEVEARKTLLCAYKDLQYVHGPFGFLDFNESKNGSHDDIDYLMVINHAGRVLVETEENKGVASGSSSIPLSLWPTVLARAGSWEGMGPRTTVNGSDGIYYLLQNVAALRSGRGKTMIAY